MWTTVGKNTTCRVEIATDKKFKNIIKRYTKGAEWFNENQKVYIHNLKQNGFKRNKKYYMRAYTYRKVKNITIRSETYYVRKFEITGDWRVKELHDNSTSWKKFKDNPSTMKIFDSYNAKWANDFLQSTGGYAHGFQMTLDY